MQQNLYNTFQRILSSSTTERLAVLIGTLIPVALLGISRITRYLLRSPDAEIAPNVSLKKKTVIITGCGSGIGLSLAKFCYQLGAHVIMANRDKSKTEKAMKEIEKQSPAAQGKLEYIPIDTANLTSVAEFVKKFHERNLDLHFLINNAGASFVRKGFKQENGKELEGHFMTNHLGHFLLLELLMEDLKKTKGRVVAVSSSAQTMITADMIQEYSLRSLMEEEEYKKIKSKMSIMLSGNWYAFSKALNTLHMKDMANRFTASTGICFYSMCPGPVFSTLGKGAWYIIPIVRAIYFFIGREPDNGAQTILHLMLSDKVTSKESGQFFRSNKIIPHSTMATEERMKELRELSLEYVNKYLCQTQ